jgi:hypothetical protein
MSPKRFVLILQKRLSLLYPSQAYVARTEMGALAETTNVDYRYRLPTKENKLQFSVFCLQKTDGSFALFVSCLQQKSCRFSLVPFSVHIMKRQHISI